MHRQPAQVCCTKHSQVYVARKEAIALSGVCKLRAVLVKMIQQATHAPYEQPSSYAQTHVAAEFDSHSKLVSEYIGQGAIVRACGISQEQVDSDVSRWRDAATLLAHNLGFDGELDAVQKQRVYQYYLPIFFWSLQQLEGHREQGHSKPLVVSLPLA